MQAKNQNNELGGLAPFSVFRTIVCLICLFSVIGCHSICPEYSHDHKFLRGDLKLPANLKGKNYEFHTTPVYAICKNNNEGIFYMKRGAAMEFVAMGSSEITNRYHIILYIDVTCTWGKINEIFSELAGSQLDRLFIAYDDSEWGGSSKSAFFLVQAGGNKSEGNVLLQLLDNGSVVVRKPALDASYSSIDDPLLLGLAGSIAKEGKEVNMTLIADKHVNIKRYLEFYQLMEEVAWQKTCKVVVGSEVCADACEN